MSDRPVTCSRQISARIREAIAGADEVVVPELVERITAGLLADPDFIARFAREHLRPSVDRLAQGVLASDRSLVRQNSARYLSPEALAAAMASDDGDDAALTEGERRSRKGWLLDFRQFVPGRKVTVRLGEMSRTDLLDAASLRTERGRSELRLAALFTQLAEPLAVGESVRDRWTDEQIAEAFGRLEQPEAPAEIRLAETTKRATKAA